MRRDEGIGIKRTHLDHLDYLAVREHPSDIEFRYCTIDETLRGLLNSRSGLRDSLETS